jgi:hypothetical protein
VPSNEKIEHMAWMEEFLGAGPPGRFRRGFRGRSPFLARLTATPKGAESTRGLVSACTLDRHLQGPGGTGRGAAGNLVGSDIINLTSQISGVAFDQKDFVHLRGCDLRAPRCRETGR